MTRLCTRGAQCPPRRARGDGARQSRPQFWCSSQRGARRRGGAGVLRPRAERGEPQTYARTARGDSHGAKTALRRFGPPLAVGPRASLCSCPFPLPRVTGGRTPPRGAERQHARRPGARLPARAALGRRRWLWVWNGGRDAVRRREHFKSWEGAFLAEHLAFLSLRRPLGPPVRDPAHRSWPRRCARRRAGVRRSIVAPAGAGVSAVSTPPLLPWSLTSPHPRLPTPRQSISAPRRKAALRVGPACLRRGPRRRVPFAAPRLLLAAAGGPTTPLRRRGPAWLLGCCRAPQHGSVPQRALPSLSAGALSLVSGVRSQARRRPASGGVAWRSPPSCREQLRARLAMCCRPCTRSLCCCGCGWGCGQRGGGVRSSCTLALHLACVAAGRGGLSRLRVSACRGCAVRGRRARCVLCEALW